ncbi:MAG: hypothetical protein A2017_05480 [Lentisphaerae bacterium GWF2_44_16]|nr:MAG: hypothetical protein A2017_05480 [Lentisphaerae bacterium GWF2_44_16]HAU66050.1 hypothetical protein [Candidatus Uhrbacteria bacterium]
MAIIISSNGGKAVKVEKSSFEKEDYLQQYIYENPESIPLYEIKEDIRLLILAREFPTNSGPIDAIGIDKYGELYIVETKLYTNTEKRRVIAQSLDYGAALWKHSNDFNEFLKILDQHTQKAFKLRTMEKISEFFELETEDVDALIEKVRDNLNNGVFHFVVLMDKLDDRLKDLILYVNQNSQFDVYAVEFEYYKHDAYEIIIPKIFGTEVKKDIAVSSSTDTRRKWTEELLLQDAKQRLSPDEFKGFEQIYAFSKQHASEIRLGTGMYGSFSPVFGTICERSLFTLSTDKRLSFNFEWTAKVNEQLAQMFKEKLETIGFSFSENFKELRPSVMAEEWLPRTKEILDILDQLLDQKKD